MYQYKFHKKSKWWNPDTMEDEEQAYCREKNYRLLTANWPNVNCKTCRIHYEFHWGVKSGQKDDGRRNLI